MKAVDPICGMTVDSSSSLKTNFHGEDFFFCSSHCHRKFSKNPDQYIKNEIGKGEMGTCCAKPERGSAFTPQNAVYTCPMHPEIKQIGPGSCPICGMALEPMEATVDEGPNPELTDFTRRLKVSIAFGIPLLIMAMGEMIPGNPFHNWFPENIMNWVQLALATPVVLWAGFPLFHRGWTSITNLLS